MTLRSTSAVGAAAKPSLGNSAQGFELAPLAEGSLGRRGSGGQATITRSIRPAMAIDVSSPPIDIPPLPSTLMTVEEIGGTQFVRIDVAAVRERQASVLADPLCGLADRHGGKVTMDLTKVAAFSCAWINVLLMLAARCKAKGGNLVLTGISVPAQHLLKQMGLAKSFTIV